MLYPALWHLLQAVQTTNPASVSLERSWALEILSSCFQQGVKNLGEGWLEYFKLHTWSRGQGQDHGTSHLNSAPFLHIIPRYSRQLFNSEFIFISAQPCRRGNRGRPMTVVTHYISKRGKRKTNLLPCKQQYDGKRNFFPGALSVHLIQAFQ